MTQAFKIGAFVSPLTASTTNPLLQDADPALAAVLAFYQAVLGIHLGARFDAEVTAAGFPDLVGRVATPAVPYDPLPHLTVAQLSPPLLAVYPAEEDYGELTTQRANTVQRWKVLWILPPLTPAQYLRLSPFLRAVAKVLFNRTEQGYDESYAAGALVWEAAGLEAIKVAHARYGTVQGLRTELHFPAVELELEVRERREAAPGAELLTGLDGNIGVADPEGGDPEFIIEFSSEDLS